MGTAHHRPRLRARVPDERPMSARRARLMWWLPSKLWRDDGWRWRVATLADKLSGQCWSSLVGWAQRTHEDDPDTPWNDLVRRLPLRSMDSVCESDKARNGTCYCGKLRTAEADA